MLLLLIGGMGESTPSPPEWLELDDGERVWMRASPSRNLVLVALAAGFVLLLVMSVAVSAMDDLGMGRAVSFAGLLVIVGLIVAAFLVTRRNEYVLTSDRVYSGRGLGTKRVRSIGIDEIHDVTIEQAWWAKLASVGTLRFVAEGDDIAFALVENPAYYYQEILQFVGVEQ